MSDLPSPAQVVRSALVVSTFCIASLAAQEPAYPPVVGRWDLTVSGGEGRHLPSWLEDRKSTRLNSSHSQISYAVFCLKKKKKLHVPLVLPSHPLRVPARSRN